MSPTTASMGISRGAIERQIRVMDPDAHTARVKERVRVETETAEAAAIGHVVEFVFVERGGSASAKKALLRLTEKLQGKPHHIENERLKYRGTQGRERRQRLRFRLNSSDMLRRERSVKSRGVAKMKKLRRSSPISRPVSRPRRSGPTRRKPKQRL